MSEWQEQLRQESRTALFTVAISKLTVDISSKLHNTKQGQGSLNQKEVSSLFHSEIVW